MSKQSEEKLIKQWQDMIEIANQNNIFCHCSLCGYEWVDSQATNPCPKCRGTKIERISCWQFPDD